MNYEKTLYFAMHRLRNKKRYLKCNTYKNNLYRWKLKEYDLIKLNQAIKVIKNVYCSNKLFQVLQFFAYLGFLVFSIGNNN